MMGIKVFVVLVNYKNFGDTIECLESLFKSNYKNFQALIIDNSPNEISSYNLTQWFTGKDRHITTNYPHLVYPLSDGPIDYVYATEEDILQTQDVYHNKVVLIKAHNRGFAAANNVALKYIDKIKGDNDFVWILNNDTVVEQDCMERLIDYFSAHSDKCILGSKLKYYHDPNRIQAVAGRFNKWIASTSHVGDGEFDSGQYDNFKFSDNNYVVGASMFLSTKFISEIGLLNEEYFLYFEELDLGLSGKKRGYKFAFEPLAIVYHKEGASIRNGKNKMSISDYYSIVNRLKFTIKWYKESVVFVFASVMFAITKRMLKGQFQLVKKIIIGLSSIMSTQKLDN